MLTPIMLIMLTQPSSNLFSSIICTEIPLNTLQLTNASKTHTTHNGFAA